jgi:hypothetical protein
MWTFFPIKSIRSLFHTILFRRPPWTPHEIRPWVVPAIGALALACFHCGRFRVRAVIVGRGRAFITFASNFSCFRLDADAGDDGQEKGEAMHGVEGKVEMYDDANGSSDQEGK